MKGGGEMLCNKDPVFFLLSADPVLSEAAKLKASFPEPTKWFFCTKYFQPKFLGDAKLEMLFNLFSHPTADLPVALRDGGWSEALGE